MNIPAPAYLPLKAAAAYCGYTKERFGRVVTGYQIPKYGPARNRFKIEDLDQWMETPAAFRVHSKRQKKGFTPVHI